MADAVVSMLREYVEFGLQSTSPGPFRSTGGRMRMFVLRGDSKRIAALIERTLTSPAGGAASYRPLGPHVLLAIGESHISSLTKPWSDWGSVREALACFWVPVWAGRAADGGFMAERLCMSVPHILVDNPISHAGGREIYGYPKALGRFEPQTDILGGPLTISGFGGDFDPKGEAEWRPVLEVAPTGPDVEGGAEREGPADLVRSLLGELLGAGDFQEADPGAVMELSGGVRLTARVIHEALAGRMRQVFLKQFRDAADQRRACYQAVVEGLARTTHVKWRPSGRDWDITIHPLESHPIAEELGLENVQRAKWSAELREYEFEVDPGEVIGP